jgi:hypothetical protein
MSYSGYIANEITGSINETLLRTVYSLLSSLFYGSTALYGPGPGPPRFVEASRSHSDTPHSVGLLWTSDQPVAETSTWQHTTLTTDRHTCPRRIRTRNPSKRAAADRRLRPRGHWDRQNIYSCCEPRPSLPPRMQALCLLSYIAYSQ